MHFFPRFFFPLLQQGVKRATLSAVAVAPCQCVVVLLGLCFFLFWTVCSSEPGVRRILSFFPPPPPPSFSMQNTATVCCSCSVVRVIHACGKKESIIRTFLALSVSKTPASPLRSREEKNMPSFSQTQKPTFFFLLAYNIFFLLFLNAMQLTHVNLLSKKRELFSLSLLLIPSNIRFLTKFWTVFFLSPLLDRPYDNSRCNSHTYKGLFPSTRDLWIRRHNFFLFLFHVAETLYHYRWWCPST